MTSPSCSCCGERAERGSVRLHGRRAIAICSRCLDRLNAQRDQSVRATGGAANIVNVEVIFAVTDLPRAVDHYQRLGFTTSLHDDTYAFARRDDQTIHLDGSPPGVAGALYLHVDDADRLAEDWRKAGLTVTGPEDDDHATREGSLTDPDGNRIRFGSPLRRSTSR